MIWGIDYLGRVGATKARFDFRPILPRLMEVNQREITWEIPRSQGSLLLGDLGTALLVMRTRPDSRDRRPGLCACGREHDPAGA